jgi:multiple sugar transport system permease protein
MKIRWVHYLMISPVQLLVLLVIFVPSVWVIWLSLLEYSYGTEAKFVGLRNYIFIATDPIFWQAFLNTFIIVNVVVYSELAIAMGIAVLFAGGVPFRRMMISIVLMPYAVSPVIAVIIWRYLLEPERGIVQLFLLSIGLPELEWTTNPVHAMSLIILLSLWLHIPFTFIILYTSILAIPEQLYEAAKIDGAGALQEFWHITIPTLVPAILVALLFRYIFAFRIFSEVWLLTEGGPVRTTEVLALYLYRYGFRYHELGVASATGWAMVLASLIISIFYLRQMYKRMFSNET